MNRPSSQLLDRGQTLSRDAAGIAGGSSFLIDDGGNIVVPVSQSQGPGGPTQVLRQRPRFATAQALDDALLQAIEGKITSKNAWASREASNLLEGIAHTIESTFDTESDEYAGFAKAATVVEGCSKVWTVRVDSTYQQSNQMVKQLLRNDTDAANGGDGGNDNGEDQGDEAGEGRRRKPPQASRPAARTLALDVSEINLDARSRVALMQTGVNAQFRAITEKFDQAHAQGLLLNNTPLGSAGNLILDVDYSRESSNYSARRRISTGGRRSGDVASGRESGCITGEAEATEQRQPAWGTFEEDVQCTSDVPLLPFVLSSLTGSLSSVSALLTSDTGADFSRDQGTAGAPRVSAPQSTLTAAHMRGALDGKDAPTAGRDVTDSAGTGLGAWGRGSALGTCATDDVLGAGLRNDVGSSSLKGEGSAVGSAEGHDYGGADSDFDRMTYEDDGIENGTIESAGYGQLTHIGAEARNLVHGTAALQAIDTAFNTDHRLALEADDSNEWCLMSDAATARPFGGVSSKSELQRLRKEYLLPQLAPTSASSPASAVPGGPGVSSGGGAAGLKRARKERPAVFELLELDPRGALAWLGGATNVGEAVMDVAGGVDPLKVSTTAHKNVTPLGKELLFGNANTVAAYTQSATQQRVAEENGLLLPTPPVRGKAIPRFCPVSASVESFFQPFSTDAPQWNLLRKTVAAYRTSGLHSSGARGVGRDEAAARGTLTSSAVEGADALDDGDGLGDFPTDFIPDENDYDAVGLDDTDPYGGNAEHAAAAESEAIQKFLSNMMSLGAESDPGAGDGTLKHFLPQVSGEEAMNLMEPLQMARALQVPPAMVPTQVDVVRLRSVMWSRLKEVLDRGEHAERQEVLAAQPQLSDVAISMLPEIPRISSNGSLSPAFLFFSILFLANEYGIVLRNADDLADLVVSGVTEQSVPTL